MTQQPLVPGAAPETVLGADDVRRAITRIAHEIVERNRGLDKNQVWSDIGALRSFDMMNKRP